MDSQPGNPNFRSNRVPLPNEVIALRSLVDAETTALETIKTSLTRAQDTVNSAQKRVTEAKLELEAAISALAASKASVQTLEALLAPIQASIQEKKAVLHPLRRLPPELLLEIFQFRVDQDESDRIAQSDLDGEWGPCDAVLRLGAVCGRWRSVVRGPGASSLWQYFNVSLTKYITRFINSQDSNPFLGRLHLWAMHSGDRSVDVAIRDIGDALDPEGIRGAVMWRRILIVLGPRIRKLQTLFTGVSSIPQILGPNMSADLISLKHIAVHVHDTITPGLAKIPQGAFRDSTGLETIQLRNVWWDQELRLPDLKVFDVYNPEWRISPRQFLSTLRECPNLRELPIEFEHKPVINQHRLSTVRFEHLESLHTTCEWITLAGPILCKFMIAPKLKNVQLYGRGDIQVITGFLENVAPNLQHLHLGTPQVQGDEPELDLVSVIKSAPNLIEFAVDGVVLNAAFFDAISDESEGVLVPMLTSLVIKNSTFSDPNALLRMIAARTRPGLNSHHSFPRRLMVLEIQGGKDMGINLWHEQEIDELMMRDDDTENEAEGSPPTIPESNMADTIPATDMASQIS
ncbi:hypothetical protein PIIN_04073 [Serendipita indica DSM 11827]|uniref:F-box domain-containing protein n=1 Tax=Serendipita indica (strain DSM 11827) TaxID=1109443 RepID=G4TFQ3_SERID|nr:hypothetical protein PIIN_04073 [Serendipita indica DSM 11827]